MEKEKREEEILQALSQKTSEQIQLQTRCLTLQDANETYQEQAKKAVDEKERVQRDYLQVVFDLGKAQKQLNAISKETIAIPEKDFLLRQIDQLQKDNDELQQKVKDLEVRTTTDESVKIGWPELLILKAAVLNRPSEARERRISQTRSSSQTCKGISRSSKKKCESCDFQEPCHLLTLTCHHQHQCKRPDTIR